MQIVHTMNVSFVKEQLLVVNVNAKSDILARLEVITHKY